MNWDRTRESWHDFCEWTFSSCEEVDLRLETAACWGWGEKNVTHRFAARAWCSLAAGPSSYFIFSNFIIYLIKLVHQADQLEHLAEREVNRRDEWRAKIRETRETHSWLVERLRRWRAHNDKAAVEEAERRELFGRTQLPSSVLEALDEEGESLTRSSNVVSSLIDSASASMAGNNFKSKNTNNT